MYGGGRPPFMGPPLGPPYGSYMGPYGPTGMGPPFMGPPGMRPPFMRPRFGGPPPMRHPYNGPATMMPGYGAPMVPIYGPNHFVNTSKNMAISDTVEKKKPGKKSTPKADPVVTTPTLAFIQQVMKKWEMNDETEDSSTKTRCDICKINVESETVYKVHILSSEHKARLEFRSKLSRSKIEQAKAELIAKVNTQIDDKDADVDKKDTETVNTDGAEKGDGKNDKNDKKIAINIQFKGKPKKERVPEKKTCKVCDIELPSIEEYMKHVQSLRHENKVNSKKKEDERERERKRGLDRRRDREDEDRGRNRSKERDRTFRKDSDRPERLSRPGRFSGGDSHGYEPRSHSRDEEHRNDSRKSFREDDLRDYRDDLRVDRESRRGESRGRHRDDDLRDDRDSRRGDDRDDLRDDRESKRSESRGNHRDDDLRDDRDSRRGDDRDDLRDDRESKRSESRGNHRDDDLRDDRDSRRGDDRGSRWDDSRGNHKADDLRDDPESRRGDSKDHPRDGIPSSTRNNPQHDFQKDQKKEAGYVRLDSRGNPIPVINLVDDEYVHQAGTPGHQPVISTGACRGQAFPEQKKRVSRFALNSVPSPQIIAPPQIKTPLLPIPHGPPPVVPHHRPPLLRAPDLTDNKEYCTVCNVTLPNNDAFIKHIGGILHKERVSRSRGDKPQGGPKSITTQRDYARNFTSFYENVSNTDSQHGPNNGQNVQSSRYCALCDVPFQSDETFNRHTRGLMHIQKMKASGIKARVEKLFPSQNTDLDRKRKFDQDGKLCCQICGIECFSLHTYQSHLERIHGHKVAIPTPPEGAGGKKTSPRSSLHQFLKQTQEPMLGLMYVTESQDVDPQIEPSFKCLLCKESFDYKGIKAHLISHDHRMECFKKHHPDVIDNMGRLRPGTEAYNLNFTYFAHDVEAKNGRGEITVEVKNEVKKTRYDDQLNALLGINQAPPLAPKTPLLKTPLLQTPLLQTPQTAPLTVQTPLLRTPQTASLPAQAPFLGASQNSSLTNQVLSLMSQQPPSLAPQRVDVAPPRVEVALPRVDVALPRVDVAPPRVDVAPQRVHVALPRVEPDPLEQLLPQLLLKSSLLAPKTTTSVTSTDTNSSLIADNARAIQQENEFLASILAALAAKKAQAAVPTPQPAAPQMLAPPASTSHWGTGVLNTRKEVYDPFEPSQSSPSHDSSYRAYQQPSYSDQRPMTSYDRPDMAKQYLQMESELDSMRSSSMTASSPLETLLQKLQGTGSQQTASSPLETLLQKLQGTGSQQARSAPDLNSLAEQIRRLQNQ